jgi:hypothetical protein
MTTKAMHTPEQIDALRWIDRFPHNKSEWRRNGRSAYGPAQAWDALQISGDRGSITITRQDWFAIRDCVVGNSNNGSIWVLNEVGRAALAKAQP